MKLTNAERQKRWRKKNRALYNLRRRNRRKAKGGDALCAKDSIPQNMNEKSANESGNAELTVQPAGSANLTAALRELLTEDAAKPVEPPVATPTVFRDDYGRVISEGQWKRLQELKQEAKEGGYEIDEYSQ